ncbi:RNA-guided endonuclease TnpB family protein [Clostridium sp. MT-14]|uniref:RNA-guided endonuclease TnpB family protein n=1 Tax=Clostridium sp. MT-14 TaxID=3348360 RepID=UPI0035F49522
MKKKSGMTKCITVILNKCFDIDTDRIKDKNKPRFHLNMNKAKEIIKEASIASCHACNISSSMWKEYYFRNREEAENAYNNMDKSTLDDKIEIEFNKRKKKIKDKSKLENEKYVFKIKENIRKDIRRYFIKNYEKTLGEEKEQKSRYGNWYSELIQNKTKIIMKDYNTGNVGTLDRQIVQGDWKRDKEKILNYEGQSPEYKKDMPVCIKNSNYKLSNNNGYFIEIGFFSRSGYEKYNLKSGTKSHLKFQMDKLDSNKKATINKIINKEYKQEVVQLSVIKKDKIKLIISYTFEPKKQYLDYNRILGIDIGIVNTAVFQIYDKNYKQYDWLNYKDYIINGQEVIKFRQRVEARRKQMQISNKWCGGGKIGHGTKTRMRAVWNIGNKINKFQDTYNHKISRYIIDFAIKNNCGTIQMEDLSGFSESAKEKFLKNWSYYDLQQKIKYKAEQEGIVVIFINPMYTSQRCNECGFIDQKNRNCKENQAKFECVNCGSGKNKRVNADINAARNIALPDIEKIILEQLEIQSNINDEYKNMYNTYKRKLKESRDKVA